MKTKSLLLTCALLASTSTVVLAQTTDDSTTVPSTTAPSATEPSTTAPSTTTEPSNMQSAPATNDSGAATTTTTEPSVTAPSTTGTTAFYQLNQGDMRASKLIGSTVYNDANENIGDINEIVLGKDGKIAAVIIGVGGFLGLGERDVAVPFDQVKMSVDAENNSKLMTALSRDSLTNAPAWSWNVKQ